MGGLLAELLNFEVSENKRDGEVGSYRHWTRLPQGSFVLETTIPGVH